MAQLSWLQVAQVARAAGWPADAAVTAVAITMPESTRNPAAIEPDQPYSATGWGLWQITPGNSEPQFGTDRAMLDPLNNAKAALAKWEGAGGFTPWTTWTSGKYAQYVPDAAKAVAAAYKLTPKQLAAAVAKARSGVPAVPIGTPSVQDWSVTVSATAVRARAKRAHTAAVTLALHQLHPRLAPPKLVLPAPDAVLIKPERISHDR